MPPEHAANALILGAGTMPACRMIPLRAGAMPASYGPGPSPRRGRPCIRAPSGETPGPTVGRDVVINVIVAYTGRAASKYSDVGRELVALSIEEPTSRSATATSVMWG